MLVGTEILGGIKLPFGPIHRDRQGSPTQSCSTSSSSKSAAIPARCHDPSEASSLINIAPSSPSDSLSRDDRASFRRRSPSFACARRECDAASASETMQVRRTSLSTAQRLSPIGFNWFPTRRFSSGSAKKGTCGQTWCSEWYGMFQHSLRMMAPVLGGARVGAHVRSFVAALVLRDAPGPLQGLAHDARNDPVDQRCKAAEENGQSRNRAVHDEHDARLTVDSRQDPASARTRNPGDAFARRHAW